MTQPTLPLDPTPARVPTLPHRGRTAVSRACSREAAQRAAGGRPTKTARYLVFLEEHGPASDHQAAAALGVPLSSICSIRNGIIDRAEEAGQRAPIVPVSKRLGPYGADVTIWGLAGRREN